MDLSSQVLKPFNGKEPFNASEKPVPMLNYRALACIFVGKRIPDRTARVSQTDALSKTGEMSV